MLSAFYSGSETALYSKSAVRLEYLHSQNMWRAKLIKWLNTPIGPTIITILIANNVVAELLARITEQSFSGLGSYSVLVTTLVVTPLVIIFGEFLPKWYARKQSDTVVYQIALVLAASRIILSIPVIALRLITQALEWIIPAKTKPCGHRTPVDQTCVPLSAAPKTARSYHPCSNGWSTVSWPSNALPSPHERIAKPLDVVEMLPEEALVKDILPKLGPKILPTLSHRNPTPKPPWLDQRPGFTGHRRIQ